MVPLPLGSTGIYSAMTNVFIWYSREIVLVWKNNGAVVCLHPLTIPEQRGRNAYQVNSPIRPS
jgi:hypothetical protein